MRSGIACIACVILLGMSSAAQRTRSRAAQASAAEQQQTQAEDQQAIDHLQQEDIDAHLALDVDKIAATWDDEVVALPPHSKPIQGAAAYRSYMEAQRKSLTNVDVLGYEQSWNEVRLLGDYAYEWGVVNERFQPAATNKELDLSYNVFRVLKREPSGSWRIYREIWNDRSSNVSNESAPAIPITPPPKDGKPPL